MTDPSPSIATPTLLSHHVAELEHSGIREKFAIDAGVYSETFRDKLLYALNRSEKSPGFKNCVPALVYRFRDANGHLNGYVSAKLDNPRKDRNRADKPIKYETPQGDTARAYFAPGATEKIDDPTCELIIVEGMKKALRAAQDGFCCIGLIGVDCAFVKGSRKLIPDLERIVWRAKDGTPRDVKIAFDSDGEENAAVRQAESKLAQVLLGAGANVKCVRFPVSPSGDDGEPTKVGLDDYLMTHSLVEFRKLLDEAVDPDPVEGGESEKINASLIDPMPAARRFIELNASCEDQGKPVPRLRYYRGEFSLWQKNRGRYQAISGDMVRAQVVRELDKSCCHISVNPVSNVMQAVKSLCIVNDRVEQPAWIDVADMDELPAFPANELLPLKNGLLHLPTFAAGGDDYFVPHSPRFFSSFSLDFEFDPEAAEPVTWLHFLEQVWGDDAQSIETLRDWFGYLLTANTTLQKMLVLCGPRRSGKGTIGRVIHSLLGRENVAGPTLAGLGTNFGLWPLLGKLAAIISDARLSGRTDSAIVTERLLSITGEDPQTVDRKCLQPVTVTLPTRLIILTNELPRLGDSSGALVGRMIVLKMSRSFYGCEDPCLTEKLLKELPGILLWAIDGWKRVRDRGRFIQPDAGRELVGEMEDLSSPVGQFVRELCVLAPSAEIPRSDLYLAWKAWCQHSGKRESDETVFGRDLRAAVPSVGSGDRRSLGARYRVYTGIALAENEPATQAPHVAIQSTCDARENVDHAPPHAHIEVPSSPPQVSSVSAVENKPPPGTPEHKPRTACDHKGWWLSSFGGTYCDACFPPKDQQTVEDRGVAP